MNTRARQPKKSRSLTWPVSGNLRPWDGRTSWENSTGSASAPSPHAWKSGHFHQILRQPHQPTQLRRWKFQTPIQHKQWAQAPNRQTTQKRLEGQTSTPAPLTKPSGHGTRTRLCPTMKAGMQDRRLTHPHIPPQIPFLCKLTTLRDTIQSRYKSRYQSRNRTNLTPTPAQGNHSTRSHTQQRTSFSQLGPHSRRKMCNKAACICVFTMVAMLLASAAVVWMLRPPIPDPVKTPRRPIPSVPNPRPGPSVDNSQGKTDDHRVQQSIQEQERMETNTALLMINNAGATGKEKAESPQPLPASFLYVLITVSLILIFYGYLTHRRLTRAETATQRHNSILTGDRPEAGSPPPSRGLLVSFRGWIHRLTAPSQSPAEPGLPLRELESGRQGFQGPTEVPQGSAHPAQEGLPLNSQLAPITTQPSTSNPLALSDPSCADRPLPAPFHQLGTDMSQTIQKKFLEITVQVDRVPVRSSPPNPRFVVPRAWPPQYTKVDPLPRNMAADPRPGSSSRTTVLNLLSRALNAHGQPTLIPSQLSTFPWGCVEISARLIVVLLSRVRELSLAWDRTAIWWRVPTLQQAAEMLPSAIGAHNIDFQRLHYPPTDYSNLLVSGDMRIMVWNPTVQQIREVLHPTMMFTHANRLAAFQRTRDVFPTPVGRIPTVLGKALDKSLAEEGSFKAYTHARMMRSQRFGPFNPARTRKQVEDIVSRLVDIPAIEWAAIPFPGQDYVQPIIYPVALGPDPTRANSPLLPVLGHLGQLYPSDSGDDSEADTESFHYSIATADSGVADADSVHESEEHDPLDIFSGPCEAEPEDCLCPTGSTPRSEMVSEHVALTVLRDQLRGVAAGLQDRQPEDPAVNQLEASVDFLESLRRLFGEENWEPGQNAESAGSRTPEVRSAPESVWGDTRPSTPVLSADEDSEDSDNDSCPDLVSIGSVYSGNMDSPSDTEPDRVSPPPITVGQLVHLRDVPMGWSSALAPPQQLERFAAMQHGPLWTPAMTQGLVDSGATVVTVSSGQAATVERLPLFDSPGMCSEVGHHVTSDGFLLHDDCKKGPEYYEYLSEEQDGMIEKLMPLSQCLLSVRSAVRTVLGRPVRFPVMCRGSVIHWTPPPEDLQLTFVSPEQHPLNKIEVDVRETRKPAFHPYTIYSNGQVTFSQKAYMRALGFSQDEITAMWPLPVHLLEYHYSQQTRFHSSPPSHFVACMMRVAGIPGPDPDTFGPLDFLDFEDQAGVDFGNHELAGVMDLYYPPEDDREDLFQERLEFRGPRRGVHEYADVFDNAFAQASMVAHGTQAVPEGGEEIANNEEVVESFGGDFGFTRSALAEGQPVSEADMGSPRKRAAESTSEEDSDGAVSDRKLSQGDTCTCTFQLHLPPCAVHRRAPRTSTPTLTHVRDEDVEDMVVDI